MSLYNKFIKFLHICIFVHLYIFNSIFLQVCTHTHTHIYIYKNIRVYIYIYTYVCLKLMTDLHIIKHMCMFICTSFCLKSVNGRAHIYKFMYVYVCVASVCVYDLLYLLTLVKTHKHIYISVWQFNNTQRMYL